MRKKGETGHRKKGGIRTLASGHLLMICASSGTRPAPSEVRIDAECVTAASGRKPAKKVGDWLRKKQETEARKATEVSQRTRVLGQTLRAGGDGGIEAFSSMPIEDGGRKTKSTVKRRGWPTRVSCFQGIPGPQRRGGKGGESLGEQVDGRGGRTTECFVLVSFSPLEDFFSGRLLRIEFDGWVDRVGRA